ncbi:MAG: DUF411 domain-containing protein [Gammaproteobacteria bacterium]
MKAFPPLNRSRPYRRLGRAGLLPVLLLCGAGGAAAVEITVSKTPQCGCCKKWVDHLRDNGFEVVVVDMESVEAVKRQNGVPTALGSCHTAVVDGYVVEGHVPADLIARLLSERPKVKGLAVPGMPMGSPGMEGPRKDPYQVLTFDGEGDTSVYADR